MYNFAHYAHWMARPCCSDVEQKGPDPTTPMAFYNRLIWVALAVLVAPLFSNIDPQIKPIFVWVGLGFAIAIAILIAVLTWLKPASLVYGAQEHMEMFKSGTGQTGQAAGQQVAGQAGL
jgi:hypothetical protein